MQQTSHRDSLSDPDNADINSDEMENEDNSSQSADTDSDFGEDDLPEAKKKFETPRPSMTEISDILKQLELEANNSTTTTTTTTTTTRKSRNSKSFKETDEKKSAKSPSPSKSTTASTTSVVHNHKDDKRRPSIDESEQKFVLRGEVRESSAKLRRRGDRSFYINQYLCYKQLGKGAYGNVVLAKDISTGKKTAIKVINKSILRKKVIFKKGEKPSNCLENIFREIAIMKKLDHPNILKLYEVIDDPSNDKLYLVLEYMEKGAILKTGGKATCAPIQDLELIRKYMRDMILGLDYLHRNNIIHADIKPDNLLIGPDNSVRIADFGVSYMLESADGTVSKALGTPAFIAPECENQYFRAYPLDIWALGVTLYMMITGICPFAGESITDTFDKIQQDNPVIPERLPGDLQKLLKALLNKNPAKRITMAQLKEDPWITRKGEEPLRHPKNVMMTVQVQDSEVEGAVNLPSKVVNDYRRASQDLTQTSETTKSSHGNDEKENKFSKEKENIKTNGKTSSTSKNGVDDKNIKQQQNTTSNTNKKRPPKLFQGVRKAPKNT